MGCRTCIEDFVHVENICVEMLVRIRQDLHDTYYKVLV